MLVPEELKQAAMKLIRAGLGHNIYVCARIAPAGSVVLMSEAYLARLKSVPTSTNMDSAERTRTGWLH